MSEKRNEVIDAFRGVAILSVLAFHYTVRWQPPDNASNIYGYRETYSPLLNVGGLGVHLFFVISGLVIAMTLERSKDAWEFAARRFARLYPAFLIAAITTFLVTSLIPIPEFRRSFGDFLATLTMDPADLHHSAIDGAYWSLAWEIKFYFLIAIAFAWFRSKFWIAVVAWSIVAVGMRQLHFHAGFADTVMIAKFAPLFLLGIGAWLFFFKKDLSAGMTVLVIATGLCAIQWNAYAVNDPLALASVAYLGAGVCLMFGLISSPWKPSLGPLPWIGRVSYSLYLLHQFIGVLIIRQLVSRGLSDMTAAVAAGCICIGAAAAMFYLVEQSGQRIAMQAYRAGRSHAAVIGKRIDAWLNVGHSPSA